MEFSKLIAQRFSVRKFQPRPVDRADLDRILQAAWLAPTAHNNQPQRILVLQSAQALEKVKKCTVCHFDAPTALLVCADTAAVYRRRYDGKDSADIDAAIAATHMLLQAEDLGVGACWVMHFIPEAVREEFALPEAYQPVAFLMLGYPDPDARPYPGHTEFVPKSQMFFIGDYSHPAQR